MKPPARTTKVAISPRLAPWPSSMPQKWRTERLTAPCKSGAVWATASRPPRNGFTAISASLKSTKARRKSSGSLSPAPCARRPRNVSPRVAQKPVLADEASVARAKASFRLATNMGEHARVVLVHHPARARQPLEHRIKLELVRGTFHDLRLSARLRQELETCARRAEIADDMRGVHMLVRTQFTHGGYIVEDHECQLALRNQFRHLLDRGTGGKLAAAHRADTLADDLAAQGISNAQAEWQSWGAIHRRHLDDRPPNQLGWRFHHNGLGCVEACRWGESALERKDQRQERNSRDGFGGRALRRQGDAAPAHAAEWSRHDNTHCTLERKTDERNSSKRGRA